MKKHQGGNEMKNNGKAEKLKKKLLSETTQFETVEAYKDCRTTIKASLNDETCKKIMITSPSLQEGKSITCANLAISFAETGEKVLVIDCNLRTPTQQILFDSEVSSNLAQYLNSEEEVNTIIGHTAYTNLDIIQAGEKPGNPSELLSSKRMSELLEILSMQYTYIFFDTPPINVVTDAAILASLVPNVVLVVRKGRTTHKSIRQALEKIKLINATMIGFILNDINKKDLNTNKI